MPRRHLVSALCLAALAAACTDDPARRCAPAETRELATVDRLIAETRADIARGYRTVQRDTNVGVNLCLGGYDNNIGLSFCTDPTRRSRTEPLDPEAATRTLDALLARRETLQARIDQAVATCPAP